MSDFIKAAVIGHPIEHSKSPLIHNHWIKKHGLKGSYEAIDLPPENLAEGLKRLIDDGYRGFNLTIPHKELALDLCDEVSPLAQRIGAVNTISIQDGKTYGTNTDAFGFIENIKSAQPDFDLTKGSSFILGAGGAARAVIVGLLDEGVSEITLINRTREKAENLAQEFSADKISVMDWQDKDAALPDTHLLVNTTALGMDGEPPLEIDLQTLPASALVNDIVYAPLQTTLLQNAKEQGNAVVTGIGMLLHQARPAFELWFGMLPDVDAALEDLVLK